MGNYESRKSWWIHKDFTTYLMSKGIKLQDISNGKQIFFTPLRFEEESQAGFD